jgi:GABA(A) receptor-associated protein
MEQFRSTSFEERVNSATRLLKKFPDRVPVLVKPGNKHTPNIDRYKYLVPSDLRVSEFITLIRKNIKLGPEKAMFIFVNNVLPPSNSTIKELYEQYKNDDGFLYLVYSLENTFGSDFSLEIF